MLLLSVFSGLLLAAAWPMTPLAFLLFFAWVPLMRVETHIATRKELKRPGLHFFGYAYIAMLVWNAITTWWIYNSTAVGGIFAIIANAALMTIPLVLFRFTRRATTRKFGYAAFIFYWISFEYIHLTWDLSWPWLTLGNGFALFPEWVQWYEYTGVLGGSLWILIANLAAYYTLMLRKNHTTKISRILGDFCLLAIVLVPILFSYYVYHNYQEKGPDTEFVVIQPNVDPFTEKFVGSENYIPVHEQINRFISLSEQAITDSTRFVLWPETAIDGALNEHYIETHPEVAQIREFINKHPQISLITGITSFNVYKDKATATVTARYREGIGYYDLFNTAMHLTTGRAAEFYHKSKLVPGVEIMPYTHIFSFLSDLVIDLGGSSGGYGRQKERTVFFSKDSIGVAPVICYESIYGDFLTGYVRNGAQYIGIITNDGWWGNSPGHRQHLVYGALRAIENRRSVARSANTGISAYINQRGDIVKATNYWEPDVVRGTIKGNRELTFYSQNGDFIGRGMAFITPFLLLSVLVKRRIAYSKKRHQKKIHN